MNETVETVKAALEETERAQNIAMNAIQLAQNNTKGTMDLLLTVSLEETCFTWEKTQIQKHGGLNLRCVCQVESETATSELRLSNTTGRLVQLEREVGLLRQNNLEVERLAETTEWTTNQAQKNAEEAQQVSHTHSLLAVASGGASKKDKSHVVVPVIIVLFFFCVKEFEAEVKDKMEDVEGLVVDKGESVLQARRIADQLQQEAKELLAESSSKLQRLEGNTSKSLFCVFLTRCGPKNQFVVSTCWGGNGTFS